MKIAFLGLGRMGAPMARHIAAAGHDLVVWNRDPTKVAFFDQVAASPAEAAAGRDAVVLMLAGPEAVTEVLDGVLETAAPHTLVIDASTIGPGAARANAARLAEHGLRYLDAPVTGSVGPAAAGTLGVLAGGAAQDYADALPLLNLWGGEVRHLGPVGTGSAAKLVRNLTLGLAVAGVGEAMRLGVRLGLPEEVTYAMIAAGPLADAMPAVLRALGSDAPGGFTIAMLTKDLGLCLAVEPDLPMTRAACAAGIAARDSGHGQDDSRALAGRIRDRT